MSTVPTFVPGFVVLYVHRAPVVIAVPAVHGIALMVITCHFMPLMLTVFTRPAFAVVIANLLMMLMPFESFMRVVTIMVFRDGAH